MTAASFRRTWLSNVRPDELSGLLVALALIPEAIGFSIVAGVDPKVGLYASFTIAVVIAFFGGRPGMISAATGAMAVVMVDLVKEHGLEYLFAATILTGVLQIVISWLKLARWIRFVPRSVMVGFVNALAIVIFMAQLPQFVGANWQMYAMVAAKRYSRPCDLTRSTITTAIAPVAAETMPGRPPTKAIVTAMMKEA